MTTLDPVTSPSMYTTKNIYREMDTSKYLKTIKLRARLRERAKDKYNPPIILERPDYLPERDWETVIYPEYKEYTENPDSLEPGWLENNHEDLRIQMSELVNTTLTSLKISKKKNTLLYGNTNNLLCLSYATNESEDLLRVMTYIGINNINVNINMSNEDDIDIDKSKVSTDFTNKIINTIVGLLYTSPNMCVYNSSPLTRSYSERSNNLIKFKEHYINGDGMTVEIGANILKSFIDKSPQPVNHYFMLLWDIEKRVIAGWIIFESILEDVPTSYSNSIHSSFNQYIHITSFCGNIPARSNGATTFIAMLMYLCKVQPEQYHGIILDSIIIIETILLYYSLGFRSVLYKKEDSIGNSNTTVYVDQEQLMVWNADPEGPYFPLDKYMIHPSTPSSNLDKGPRKDISTDGRISRWTFDDKKGEISLRDVRAFIAIATKGFPLKRRHPDINESPLYKEFEHWIAKYPPSSRYIIGKGGRGRSRRIMGKGGRGRSRRIKRGGMIRYGNPVGPLYLVPDDVFTKYSKIYEYYVEGTLNIHDRKNIYVKDDHTFLDFVVDDSEGEDMDGAEMDGEDMEDLDSDTIISKKSSKTIQNNKYTKKRR